MRRATRLVGLIGALSCAAALTAALTPSHSDAAERERQSLVFTGVTVLDGLGGVDEDATVSVSDGRLRLAPVGDARTVDVDGAFLAPGFVEANGRLGYVSQEAEITRELTAWIDARDLADPTARAFREAALEGTTTVVLAPGPRNLVSGLSQAFHAWTRAGRAEPIADAPKSLHAAISRSPSIGNFPPRRGPTTSIYARRPTTRMGVVWLLRQVFLSAKGVQKATNDADLAPYRDVLDGRRPLRVDCHRLQDVNATLRLADEAGMNVVLDGAEEAYLRRDDLAKRGVPVVLGPFPDVRTGIGVDFTDTALRNATMLHEAGVTVALSAGTSGARWLREQGMFAVRYGLSRDDALAAMTSVPADLCGLTDRGRIVDGAAADVVLWSGHPLLPTSRMLMVVVDGEVVFDRTGFVRKEAQ